MRRKKKPSTNFKVFELKLRNTNPEYFRNLFLEAKWLSNSIISSEHIFNYDQKTREVDICVAGQKENRQLKTISSQMKQGILFRIQNNIKGLSVRKKKGAKVGRLKFVKEINSIPLCNQTFVIKGNKVRLQKHKQWFQIRGVEQLGKEPDIRCGTLIRKPSGIYLHVCIAVEKTESVPTIANIGLDFGVKDHLTFSDGTKINFSAKDQEKKIRKAHKNISRKQSKSHNWYKAKRQLKKKYEKLNNIKKDASNKIISSLKFFNIVFQDEMIFNWQKGLFGRQIQSSILGRVKLMLQKNTNNLMIDRSLRTTKACFACGKVNDIKLKDRTYSCDCGYSCDRDIHSARNMLMFAGLEQASVERESDFQKIVHSIQCKHLSVKQEASPFRAE